MEKILAIACASACTYIYLHYLENQMDDIHLQRNKIIVTGCRNIKAEIIPAEPGPGNAG